MDLKNKEVLRRGDKVWVWTADTPLKQQHIGKSGTVIYGGIGHDVIGVELSDYITIRMCAHRFHKRPQTLQYDPNQQGDTDDDI